MRIIFDLILFYYHLHNFHIGLLILFLPKINVAFLTSKAGDKLGSSDDVISTATVKDFFLGNFLIFSSFTLDATNLGVGKNVV